MKNINLIFWFLMGMSVYSQSSKHTTITSVEGIKEYNKRKSYYDSLRDNFKPNEHIDSVLIYLNNYRIENDLKPLKLDSNLSKVAELQSKYCADNLILTHFQKEEAYKDCFKRGLYFNEYVGGEIAAERTFSHLMMKNETISSSPINGFKKSAGHSFLMKYEKFKRCGISIIHAEKNKNTYYVIIVFSEY